MTVDVDMWDLGHHQWEATRVRRSTRSAEIRQLEGMGLKCFMLSVDDDTEF